MQVFQGMKGLGQTSVPKASGRPEF